MFREIGNNSHGFSNEESLVLALDGKRFNELNGNLKNFIKEISEEKAICIEKETIIYSELVKNNKVKQDIIIIIKEQLIYISVKMGRGNSVHQENIEDFITYLNENFEDVTEEIKNAFRFFIWADGTLDGKAKIEFDNKKKVIGRFGGPEFKKKYPEKRKIIQDFVNSHKEELIERFLFIGKNNSKVDYIYYGTPINGSWINSKKLIEYNLIENKENKTISLGRMGIQSWNVNLKGSESSEKKRGQIQVKYGSLQKDLNNLLLNSTSNKGTKLGDKYEFDISSSLNRNKKNKFWEIIKSNSVIDKLEDIYVVKVSKKVHSNISDRKVLAKSDAYVIRAKISESDLLRFNYELTEDLLEKEKIKFSFIQHTGISVKRTDSKNFTIVKLTKSTFNKFFDKYFENTDLIFTGAMLYVNEPEIYKNQKLLTQLKVSEKELLKLVNEINLKETNVVKKIKNYCLEKIREKIDLNKKLKNALFKGEGVYEDPYYIKFITRNGILSTNVIYDYYITTGSGRSKGNFTLILKPQK